MHHVVDRRGLAAADDAGARRPGRRRPCAISGTISICSPPNWSKLADVAETVNLRNTSSSAAGRPAAATPSAARPRRAGSPANRTRGRPPAPARHSAGRTACPCRPAWPRASAWFERLDRRRRSASAARTRARRRGGGQQRRARIAARRISLIGAAPPRSEAVSICAWPSAGSAVATMSLAPSPASMICAAGVPWSMKRSGSVIDRILSPPSSSPREREMLHDQRAEPADRALLDDDQHPVVARELLDQRGVERLGEAGIGHRAGEARARQLVGRAQAVRQPGAERQDRHRRALAHDPAPADRQRRAALRQHEPGALAARIAHRARAVVDRRLGRDHVHQLELVARRHDRHARQAAEIGQVEAAGMGRAVRADQPGAVDREPDRQLLDRDVVHDLVVRALQERAVDRAERAQPLGRHAGGEGHRVLLGDADVEAAIGEAAGEPVEPGAGRHRRRDRHDPSDRPPPRRSARWRTPACIAAAPAAP